MATLDFPNPADYPVYEEAGIRWTWNSTLNVWSTDVATGGGGGGDGLSLHVGDAAPPDPVVGRMWYCTSSDDEGGGRLYVYYDNTWIDASVPGAITAGEANDLYLSKTVNDTAAGAITFEKVSTHEGGVKVTDGFVAGGKTRAIEASSSTGTDAVVITANSSLDLNSYVGFTSYAPGNVADLTHFSCSQSRSSTYATVKGFSATNNLINGTTASYGFWSDISIDDGPANYNFFASGNAPSFFQGITEHAGGIKLPNLTSAGSLATDADGNIIVGSGGGGGGGSQWIDGASWIYYNAGLVGIGTDAPWNKLSVRGTGQATGVDQTEYISSFRADDALVNIGGVNNKGAIQVTGAGTSNKLLLNPFAGNVGINTDNPDRKLHVTGEGLFENNGNQIYLYKGDGTSTPTFMLRNDGLNMYMMVSDPSTSPNYSFNSKRPFRVDLSTGLCVIEGSLTGNVSGSSGSCTGNSATATTATNCSRSVTGGNGLGGGGALTANRTLTVQAANNTINVAAGGISVAGGNVTAGNCSRTVSTSNGLTGGGALTGNITISGVSASTSAKGTVQLNNTISSTSTSQAATANAVKAAYDRAASYAPSKSGSGATGTWGISISGNAKTVTGGVYTSGNQSIGGTKTFTSPIIAAGPNAGAPAFAFSGNTNTGIYRGGTNKCNVACNGSAAAEFATTHILWANSGNALEVKIKESTSLGSRYYLKGKHSCSSLGVDGTNTFNVRGNGDVYSNGTKLTCDERFKENIVTAPSQWDQIKNLRLVNYNWKDNSPMGRSPADGVQLGLIAQEAEAVTADLVETLSGDDPNPETRIVTVTTDEDGTETTDVNQIEYKGITEETLVFKMLGALVESQQRIEDLEARIAALEGA